MEKAKAEEKERKREQKAREKAARAQAQAAQAPPQQQYQPPPQQKQQSNGLDDLFGAPASASSGGAAPPAASQDFFGGASGGGGAPAAAAQVVMIITWCFFMVIIVMTSTHCSLPRNSLDARPHPHSHVRLLDHHSFCDSVLFIRDLMRFVFSHTRNIVPLHRAPFNVRVFMHLLISISALALTLVISRILLGVFSRRGWRPHKPQHSPRATQTLISWHCSTLPSSLDRVWAWVCLASSLWRSFAHIGSTDNHNRV